MQYSQKILIAALSCLAITAAQATDVPDPLRPSMSAVQAPPVVVGAPALPALPGDSADMPPLPQMEAPKPIVLRSLIVRDDGSALALINDTVYEKGQEKAGLRFIEVANADSTSRRYAIVKQGDKYLSLSLISAIEANREIDPPKALKYKPFSKPQKK